MPRQNSITSADSTIRCAYCNGLGQIENLSQEEGANKLGPCPLCEGLGRIMPGGGNKEALKLYLKEKALKESND